MATIKTGIRKPAQKKKDARKEKVIEYGVRTPSSDFDKSQNPGPVSYVLPSKAKGLKPGINQKKRHKSSGKGQ